MHWSKAFEGKFFHPGKCSCFLFLSFLLSFSLFLLSHFFFQSQSKFHLGREKETRMQVPGDRTPGWAGRSRCTCCSPSPCAVSTGPSGRRGTHKGVVLEVFFSMAENCTTLLCTSTKMINSSMLIRMPLHMLSCLPSHFFPVGLCLVLRPFPGYSLGWWLSNTYSIFSQLV